VKTVAKDLIADTRVKSGEPTCSAVCAEFFAAASAYDMMIIGERDFDT
jgi:hypothetical protein